MPGIAGYKTIGQEPNPTPWLDPMLDSMCHSSWFARESAVDSATGVALGRISLGFVNTAPQPIVVDGCQMVMDGEIYAIDGKAVAACSGQARQLLSGYIAEGAAYFSRVEGRFVAAIWNAAQQELVMVNDKFGTKPLYYTTTSDGLFFASEVKALLTHSSTSQDLNLPGAAQFFTFGHLWNDDTLYEGIRCLTAATCVVYDARKDEARSSVYWRLKPQGTLATNDALDTLDARLTAAVEARTSESDGLGIALSGGLDARTLLALVDSNRTQPLCVSCGMEGSLDQLSARQLAVLAGCDFRAISLDQRFLNQFASHMADMIDLTDGQYLSQCIVMPTLPLYREWGVQKLLRGHAGELLHMHKAYNFSLDQTSAALAGDQLEAWLFGRLKSFMVDGVQQPLLRGMSNTDMEATARESLRVAFSRTSSWTHAVDRVGQLFLDQRTRRETAVSLAKFNSVVEPRVPYLDGSLVEAIFATPWQLRIGEAIQTSVLRRHRPAFLAPLNSNTGAPVGASPLRKSLGYWRMKVLAKLGARGYQPYERIGLWLRRELYPLVKSILLDPRCLERGIFSPDTVRTVVAQHGQGKNHTYLILAMMIFESGRRRLCDGDTSAGPVSSVMAGLAID